MTAVLMVYSYNIAEIWSQVAPVLQPAVDRMGTHDIEDIRKAILAGNAQLWVQWNNKVESAIVTEFKNYPKGLWMNIWLAGAYKETPLNEVEFERHIFEFMKANDCKGISQEGRKGWRERHKHLNIKEYIVYYLKADDIARVA